MPTMFRMELVNALRNKRIKTKTYLMVVSYDLDGNRKCKGSNRVRAGFESGSNSIKYCIKGNLNGLSKSNTARTQLETFECNGVSVYWFLLCPRLDS